MLFNSIEYLLFLPIVFAIYWLLRNHLKLQNLFVVIASYVFYGWWDYKFLLLIAFTSLCSYASGLLIDKSKRCIVYGVRCINWAKFWLITNIVINLGILAVFKYYDFFVSEFGALFGISTESLLLRIILPVGISFYTFQALSYSIDVYRGNIKPTKDIIAFFAFISFFPQLVAGPIERATNLLPQFLQKRTFGYEQGVDGMRQILWGLFKKIVVADNCAMYVDQVWATYDTQSGSTLLLAAILFTFQIYGDFSGYSDIAIGTAKLFGIKLMRNFNNPYFSRDIAEFWRRWHISLTTWFRDYVYIPLGGSRPVMVKENNIENTVPENNQENNLFESKPKMNNPQSLDNDSQLITPQSACMQASRQPDDQLLAANALPDYSEKNDSMLESTKKSKNVFAAYLNNIELRKKLIVVRNVMVVFLICGLWHGANWTYLVWGLYNVVLFLSLILMRKSKRNKDVPLVRQQFPQMLITFVLVTIGWIIFRAPSLSDALGYLCAMTNLSGAAPVLPITQWIGIIFGLLTMIAFEWSSRNSDQAPIPHRWWIYYLLITAIWWYAPSFSTDFIYFQF